METRPSKIARMGNAVDVHSARNIRFVEMQLEADGELVNKNYFTQAYLDFWPEILDFVTEAKDIKSVLCASHIFSNVWGSRRAAALFPFVVSILMEKYNLHHDEISACRLVNKASKIQVYGTLSKLEPLWLRTAYRFSETKNINSFMEKFQGAGVSPFVSGYCRIFVEQEEDFDSTVDMLSSYGKSLHSFVYSFNDEPPIPLVLTGNWVKILELVPNVQSFVLKLPDAWKCLKDEVASFPPFPPLSTLTKLSLVAWEEAESINPKYFVEAILKAYGKQLTYFKCDCLAFLDADTQFLSTYFCGLSSFEIYEYYEELEFFVSAHQKLSQMDWPNLTSLTFGGRVPTMHSKQTFVALNRFRNSLKSLCLGGMGYQSFGFKDNYPEDVLPFPKLTHLTVDFDDDNDVLWHLFRSQFTNLRVLKFEWQDSHCLDRVPPPLKVSDVNLMNNRFYTIFPKLQKLILDNRTRVFVYLRDLSL